MGKVVGGGNRISKAQGLHMHGLRGENKHCSVSGSEGGGTRHWEKGLKGN